MKQALMTVANWIWNKITNIDYAMIAAAFVEVPRWAVAFAAIREPMWAAVPMGLLLAWAASAGWKAYFEDKSRVLLLIINSASLVLEVRLPSGRRGPGQKQAHRHRRPHRLANGGKRHGPTGHLDKRGGNHGVIDVRDFVPNPVGYGHQRLLHSSPSPPSS
jgi:hypothetical protein